MVHIAKLPRDRLVDLINAYDEYVQSSNENRTLPVGVKGFYMAEYQSLLKEREARKNLDEILRNPPAGTFEYLGYHFVPYRAFYKGETDRRLDTDSRPWKLDSYYAMRNMRSDSELGFSRYDWKKADYNGNDFVAAAGANECDIYRCLENGKMYVPYENELYQ